MLKSGIDYTIRNSQARVITRYQVSKIKPQVPYPSDSLETFSKFKRNSTPQNVRTEIHSWPALTFAQKQTRVGSCFHAIYLKPLMITVVPESETESKQKDGKTANKIIMRYSHVRWLIQLYQLYYTLTDCLLISCISEHFCDGKAATWKSQEMRTQDVWQYHPAIPARACNGDSDFDSVCLGLVNCLSIKRDYTAF